jgi:hypothetical protein
MAVHLVAENEIHHMAAIFRGRIAIGQKLQARAQVQGAFRAHRVERAQMVGRMDVITRMHHDRVALRLARRVSQQNE